MKFISHRGNLNGRNESMENHPLAIQIAMNAGFDVEIDVWLIGDAWFLGHDKPQYPINIDFLFKEGIWCHAKNIEALERMLLYPQIHCFWHQEDDVTLTSRNFIWTYPGKPLTENSIAVLPELNNDNSITMLPENIFGICSDFILEYIDEYK
jgi:hypothetical protein